MSEKKKKLRHDLTKKNQTFHLQYWRHPQWLREHKMRAKPEKDVPLCYTILYISSSQGHRIIEANWMARLPTVLYYFCLWRGSTCDFLCVPGVFFKPSLTFLSIFSYVRESLHGILYTMSLCAFRRVLPIFRIGNKASQCSKILEHSLNAKGAVCPPYCLCHSSSIPLYSLCSRSVWGNTEDTLLPWHSNSFHAFYPARKFLKSWAIEGNASAFNKKHGPPLVPADVLYV